MNGLALIAHGATEGASQTGSAIAVFVEIESMCFSLAVMPSTAVRIVASGPELSGRDSSGSELEERILVSIHIAESANKTCTDEELTQSIAATLAPKRRDGWERE